MLNGRATGRGRATGLSLIELLVAILVASVGLLGFVALQASSLRYTHVTQRRVLATMLAEDFTERLRANTVAAGDVQAYEFTEPFAAQVARPVDAAATSCEGPTANCPVVEMAAYDVAEVRRHVRALLRPDGALLARRDPADAEGRTLDLWLAWREGPPLDPDAALRPAGECPAELGVDADPSVRCLRSRVRR